MKTVASKLRDEAYQELVDYCSEHGLTPSACLRKALEKFFRKEVTTYEEADEGPEGDEELIAFLLHVFLVHYAEDFKKTEMWKEYLSCKKCGGECDYREKKEGKKTTWQGLVCRKCGWELTLVYVP